MPDPNPTRETIDPAVYAGVDPGEQVAPLACSTCGGPVSQGRCQRCGTPADRREGLLSEYGPEILVPGATPTKRDLSGLAWVIEGLCIVGLGLILFLIVRFVFGGWTIWATLFTFVYWSIYVLIRRRSLRAATVGLARYFRLDDGDSGDGDSGGPAIH